MFYDFNDIKVTYHYADNENFKVICRSNHRAKQFYQLALTGKYHAISVNVHDYLHLIKQNAEEVRESFVSVISPSNNGVLSGTLLNMTIHVHEQVPEGYYAIGDLKYVKQQ